MVISNDVTALAREQLWFGAGRTHSTFGLVTVGAGLGFGVVREGHVLEQLIDNGHLLSHAPIDATGPACALGHHGCVAAYLNRDDIEARLAQHSVRQCTSTNSFATPVTPQAHGPTQAARALGHLVATFAGALQTDRIVLAGEDVTPLVALRGVRANHPRTPRARATRNTTLQTQRHHRPAHLHRLGTRRRRRRNPARSRRTVSSQRPGNRGPTLRRPNNPRNESRSARLALRTCCRGSERDRFVPHRSLRPNLFLRIARNLITVCHRPTNVERRAQALTIGTPATNGIAESARTLRRLTGTAAAVVLGVTVLAAAPGAQADRSAVIYHDPSPAQVMAYVHQNAPEAVSGVEQLEHAVEQLPGSQPAGLL